MDIRTGQTVYETIFSVDSNGVPATAATFTSVFYVNGAVSTAVDLTLSSINPVTGAFTASFASTIFGFHQFALVSSVNRTIYISNLYLVKPNNEIDFSVYVGL